MRRRLLLPVLGASIAFAMGTPAATVAQTAGNDSVVGTFTVGELSGSFAFEARLDAESGPTGESPGGTFVHSPNGYPSVYSVVCLQVSGNTAVVGVNYAGQPDFGLVFRVVDGSVDTFAVADRNNFLVSPDECAGPTAFSNPLPVISGDIVVHDAAPFPTSKDQCKNGGWRNFPGFKNEGACVSFVATGGKNTP